MMVLGSSTITDATVRDLPQYLDPGEGLEKAVAFLRPILLERPMGLQWWDNVQPGRDPRPAANC